MNWSIETKFPASLSICGGFRRLILKNSPAKNLNRRNIMAKFLDNTNTGEFISNEKIDRSLSVQEETTKLIFGD
jgi:hypothetical protein